MELDLPRFVDFHLHLRAGKMLADMLPYHTNLCAGAIVMPNVPAVFTGEEAKQYRKAIQRLDPAFRPRLASDKLGPLMTIQISAATTPSMIYNAHRQNVVAAKVYPRHGTTGSGHGLTREQLLDPPDKLLASYAEMASLGMVLQLHPEMPGSFCLYRERDFLPVAHQLTQRFPNLRLVLEHVSTAAGVQFVWGHPTVAATITPMHLLYDLDAVIGPPLDPWNLCMPIYKTPEDREALIQAVCSGHERIFAGTDSAPHSVTAKTNFTLLAGGSCAGVFAPARVALSVYAEVLASRGALEQLGPFTSGRGCAWYRLEQPRERLRVLQRPWTVESSYAGVVPLCRGQTLNWDAERID